MTQLTRRSLIGGAAMLTTGAAASMVGFSGKALAEETSWTDERDVVIVGAGFAGLGAAITAKTEFPDLNCVVLEAAPFYETGGNSRVCGQVYTTMDDVDKAVTYLQECNGGADIVEEEYIRAWAQRETEAYQWLADLGCDLQKLWIDCDPPYNGGIEFPEYHGSDGIVTYAFGGSLGGDTENSYGIVGGALYNWGYEKAMELGVEIKNDTRVVDFVLDPETREVRGVATEAGDAIKARRGVIMACGGFENDLETMRQYFPLPSLSTTMSPDGTFYNRGDGLRMCQRLGAKMWHMNNFASVNWQYPLTEDLDPLKAGSISLTTDAKDFVFIGPRGKRFVNEERTNFLRHGKSCFYGGVYTQQPMFTPAWTVFGSEKFEATDPIIKNGKSKDERTEYMLGGDGTNESALEQGIIIKGDTLEELAANMGLDERWIPDFVDEITQYNEVYCDEGYDYDFKRGTYFFDDGCPQRKEIKEFELQPLEPPFYAIRMTPYLLNTQGGPKRNGKGEILDIDENVIPRIWGAGEFGAIFASDYNGGFNVVDAWMTGREAMRTAAEMQSWE